MEFLSADYHLGEQRFEIMNRPFTDTMEMINTLIENHNKMVKPNDDVYYLGDICWDKTPEFLPYMSSIFTIFLQLDLLKKIIEREWLWRKKRLMKKTRNKKQKDTNSGWN